MLTDFLTCVGSDVRRSSVGAKEGLWISTRTSFKKPFKMLPWLLERFTWKFAQRKLSRAQKTRWEWNLKFLLVLLSIVCQSSNPSENNHFGRFSTINSARIKNSKIRSHQVFCALEKYVCTNFQVKRSNGHGEVVEGFSKSWSKTVFLSEI